ncbi:MAG: beta-ketoacyl-[acyl-carrier-protein] synthase family protein [Planctomycetota bacterium]|nr:MAG: beta-ketoacyl-[acyl-carrier-protein] synthase family protein [Planctomycetota bacterium]REK39396.1 MAG: beta-ketoacyl-[acyl-carrier-protein] synthase family protein [Planctomycetota bacterium]
MRPTQPRRVAITGIGVVSPLGQSSATLWDNLSAGHSGVRPLEALAAFVGETRFGAPAAEFTGHIDEFGELAKDQKKLIRKGTKLMCRETMMGVAASQRALQDAGLAMGDYDPERTGCVFGSDYMLTMPEDFVDGAKQCVDDKGDFAYEQWGSQGLPRVSPLWLLFYLPNMPASHVAIYNDLRGPSNSLTQREAASNLAVGEAAQIIGRGTADVMVAGATGTRLHPMNMLHALQHEEVAGNHVAPAEASRPFDRDRTGMVLGEGSGAVILEELEAARARGARIYGEVVGVGSSSVTRAPSIADRRRAIANALAAALRQASLARNEVGHVHAHGLATRACDADEAAAIATVFGDRGGQPPVVAAKSHLGNLGAGGGMIELAASLLAQQQGRLFRVLNYETPDEACDVNVVRHDEAAAGKSFVNINVTPQGQASVLAVRAAE